MRKVEVERLKHLEQYREECRKGREEYEKNPLKWVPAMGFRDCMRQWKREVQKMNMDRCGISFDKWR
jgi:hypothetical protein